MLRPAPQPGGDRVPHIPCLPVHDGCDLQPTYNYHRAFGICQHHLLMRSPRPEIPPVLSLDTHTHWRTASHHTTPRAVAAAATATEVSQNNYRYSLDAYRRRETDVAGIIGPKVWYRETAFAKVMKKHLKMDTRRC